MTLIMGEMFILFILLACLAYTVYTIQMSKDFSDINKLIKMNYDLYESAISGLCIVWLGSLFIDYIDKHREKL